MTLRILCGVTIALALVALIFFMIPGRLALAGGALDLSGKLAIPTALIAVMIASQRAQWRSECGAQRRSRRRGAACAEAQRARRRSGRGGVAGAEDGSERRARVMNELFLFGRG